MLQVKHVCKQYKTGDLVQKALNDVSLNLRDNEFVAILGPSGSGKTTLLNVIGGLDRYDSGDLIINGVSTKQYTDRDWDSYRNHTIGFIFQSYNLIPHQSVLANVELALTISGVSRSERKKRAKQALADVGLGSQIHKRPNQLSGGQMQRVAIARALVNDPDILLADEPTGALDTDTGIQVMDLLKEVAKDRLVVMVTHNPQLAEQYATRIVNLSDGCITGDSQPYEINENAMAEPEHKNMGHVSMSFGRSLSLSLNNLLTKRGRTILTAFAGSIGIIGISLIIAFSSGVNDYIGSIQSETMAEYPVQITSSGIDISSMLDNVESMVPMGEDEMPDPDEITVTSILETMFTAFSTNDLQYLKEYFDSGESGVEDYSKTIEYKYDIDPEIYLYDGDTYNKVNPADNVFGVSEGSFLGTFVSNNTMMQSMGMTSSFYQMPEDTGLYQDNYDVKAGRWPENYNECVLVLTSMGNISDLLMYTLGLRDYSELTDMFTQYALGEDLEFDENYSDSYTYDDILGTKYKLIYSADYYEYDEEYEIWVDKTDNSKYMKEMLDNAEDLEIVGVVKPKEDATTEVLTSGINYLPALTQQIVTVASEKDIVKDQIANPKTDVFTGEEFGEDSEGFDIASMFGMDESSIADAFDLSSMMDSMDLSGMLDSIDMSSMMNSIDMSSMLNSMDMSGMIDSMIGDFALTMDISDLMGDMDMSSLMSSMDLSSMLDMSSLMSSMDLSSMLDTSSLDLSSMLDMSSLDLSSMLDMSSLDLSSMLDMSSLDLSSMFDMSSLMSSMDLSSLMDFSNMDLSSLMQGLQINISMDDLGTMLTDLVAGYEDYLTENPVDFSAIFGDFSAYLQTSDAQSVISSALLQMLDNSAIQIETDSINGMLSDILDDYNDWVAESVNNGEVVTAEDYIATGTAIAIFNKWAAENITISDDFSLDTEMLSDMTRQLVDSYMTFSEQNNATAVSDVLTSFEAYLSSDSASGIISSSLVNMIDTSSIESQITAYMTTYMAGMMTSLTGAMEEQITAMTDEIISQMSDAMLASISDATASYTDSISSSITDSISDSLSGSMDDMIAAYSASITDSLSASMSGMTDGYSDLIADSMGDMMNEYVSSMSTSMGGLLSDSISTDALMDSMNLDTSSLDFTDSINSMVDQMMDGFAGSMADSINIDTDAIMDAMDFNFDMDSMDFTDLLTSMTGSSSGYDSNLSSLGYVDFDKPSEIDIYPLDFESKDAITAILDDYNYRMEANGEEEKVITYTDMVGTMMSAVTTIIDVVSYVLIAFVAVSLIVSSIMIGIITYISVLERTKEIGILRAMGASKRNISQIFNAETFIIGLFAGLLGVLISYLLIIPINLLLSVLITAAEVKAVLPVADAALLVILSMVLTLIGGAIPSRSAAKKDPVSALRTE